jgi:hypothetical protein
MLDDLPESTTSIAVKRFLLRGAALMIDADGAERLHDSLSAQERQARSTGSQWAPRSD